MLLKSAKNAVLLIGQLWLTSHPRSILVLLDTGTAGTSRDIFNEDADGETRTRNPSQTIDSIHQLDKFNSFSAIAVEIVSLMARALCL